MKRLFMTLAMVTCISLTSFTSAEVGILKKDRGDIPKELKLTKDQKDQVKKINEDFGKQIQAVKRTRITEEMQRMKIQKLNEEKRDAIGKILTPEQQTMFEKRMPRMGSFPNRSHRGDIYSDLNLTDDQKDKLKTLREEYGEEREKANDKHQAAINKILTPEQQAQMKEKKDFYKHNRKDRMDKMRDLKKLDEAGKAKYTELKDTYEKEKKAVEMSRIAPDMQKMKLDILKENFEKASQELFDAAK